MKIANSVLLSLLITSNKMCNTANALLHRLKQNAIFKWLKMNYFLNWEDCDCVDPLKGAAFKHIETMTKNSQAFKQTWRIYYIKKVMLTTFERQAAYVSESHYIRLAICQLFTS